MSRPDNPMSATELDGQRPDKAIRRENRMKQSRNVALQASARKDSQQEADHA